MTKIGYILKQKFVFLLRSENTSVDMEMLTCFDHIIHNNFSDAIQIPFDILYGWVIGLMGYIYYCIMFDELFDMVLSIVCMQGAHNCVQAAHIN